jgi:hypothetical protein
MLLNEIFPSKYIKAADLKGREVTVIIANVEIEKIGDDRKMVIYFQGKEKGLVTNKTNANRIAMLYGEDTDQWIGREILLGTDFVDYQGKSVEAVRVKPPVKRAAAPTRETPRQPVVTQKNGYQSLEMRPTDDPIEEATGVRTPNRLVDDDPIPF